MSVEDYLRRPYTKTLRADDEGDVVARVLELPGCIAHGATEAEALENLEEVQRAWLELRLEHGLEIPLPEEETALPSGRWVQRVPRSLHKKLVELAGREKVSLNQLVTSILAESVGQRAAAAAQRDACAWDACQRSWYQVDWEPERASETSFLAMQFLRQWSESLPSRVLIGSEYGDEAERHRRFVRPISANA
jgi:predicted RNase H-like HicB family nuclease